MKRETLYIAIETFVEKNTKHFDCRFYDDPKRKHLVKRIQCELIIFDGCGSVSPDDCRYVSSEYLPIPRREGANHYPNDFEHNLDLNP